MMIVLFIWTSLAVWGRRATLTTEYGFFLVQQTSSSKHWLLVKQYYICIVNTSSVSPFFLACLLVCYGLLICLLCHPLSSYIYIYGINQNKQSRALHERLKKLLRPLKKHPQKLVFGHFFLNIPLLHVVKASYQFWKKEKNFSRFSLIFL